MENRKVVIPAISCAHCGRTIERELGELAGVQNVTVDVTGKTAGHRGRSSLRTRPLQPGQSLF